jgi:predicted TIM-barrel fold metal-dependent hydrolase
MRNDQTLFTRRPMLQASAALSVGCFTSARGETVHKAIAAKRLPPGKYIDAHVHIGTIPIKKNEPLTAEDLLRWLDTADISQAWVLPLVSPEAYPNPVSTEYVLEATKPYRDRLIPFCVIDPRNSWYGKGKGKGLRTQLQKYVDAGAKGFGEHKPGIAIDDPRNMELYAACVEMNLSVVFHLDANRNTDLPGLPGLEKVLKAFPKLPLIGHAPGFWASISGDVKTVDQLGRYPKTKIVPGGALDRLFDKYPNLHGDVSSGSGNNALTRDPKFTIEFLKRRADQLLFGTDYLEKGWDTGQHDLFRRVDLPADVQQKIFRGNAQRLVRS